MIKGIVFDLDGTLYRGDTVVDGALAIVSTLLDSRLRVFFMTNNSGKTREQIVDKLKRIGFPAKLENTYCAAHALAEYLAKEKLAPFYVVGTDGLRSELASRNIRVEDSWEVQAVVVGFDPSFSYCQITMALEAIVTHGAKLVVANLDPWYPAEDGKILPGCGAMVGAIVGATGHQPDFVVGKPNTYMLELLCREHGLSPAEICVVGDGPESDMAMASNFGCTGILLDPEKRFPAGPNTRVANLNEIVSLINSKGGGI